MTGQTIPRGHHLGPQRGEVLGTETKLGASFGFQCQGKIQGETKVLTSMLVEEGSLGPRVPVNWGVQMPHLSLLWHFCKSENLASLVLSGTTSMRPNG
jgi:hypothetical protein